jgi:SMI1 / KNR4 family (SUKH-1)
MLTPSEMKRLCDRLDVVQREYLVRAYHMKVDAPNVYKRFPPATAAEITALEKTHGMKCPPSYRSFLKIQNGWRRFGLGWSLLGANRPESKDLQDTVKQTLARSGVVATDEEQRQLLEKERKDPRVIHPRHHWIIGTDANFNLLVFDRHRVSKAGEPEVAVTRYIIHVEQRWKTFEAFFRDVLARVEKRVKELRARAEKQGADSPVARRPERSRTARVSRPRRGKSARRRTPGR